MLRNLLEIAKVDWKVSLAKVVHAYNCTCSEATGYTPYFLSFGRNPMLPIDLMLGLTVKDQSSSHRNYTEEWKTCMLTNWPQRQPVRRADNGKLSMTEKPMVQSCTLDAE